MPENDMTKSQNLIFEMINDRMNTTDKNVGDGFEKVSKQIATVHQRIDDIVKEGLPQTRELDKKMESHCRENKEQFERVDKRLFKIIAAIGGILVILLGGPEAYKLIIKLLG